MVAYERLLGPLPLKEKKSCNNTDMEETVPRFDKQEKGTVGVIYMSQLRRSQYPMVQLCRRSHRVPRNHFRKHADIKHKGKVSSVNEWQDYQFVTCTLCTCTLCILLVFVMHVHVLRMLYVQ